jgi:hypothetical protein
MRWEDEVMGEEIEEEERIRRKEKRSARWEWARDEGDEPPREWRTE